MPHKGYSKYQKIISLLGDVCLLVVAFLLGYYLRMNAVFSFEKYDYVIVFLVYLFSWWLIESQGNFAISSRGIGIEQIVLKTIRNAAFHIAVVYLAMIVFKFYGISRLTVFYIFLIQLFLIISWRILFYRLLSKYRQAGYNFRKVAIVGATARASDFYNTVIPQNVLGYKFMGFFAEPGAKVKLENCVVYPLDEFEKTAHELGIEEVFCTLDNSQEQRIVELINFCENNLIRFKLVPAFQKYIRKKVTIDFIEGIPLVLLRPEPLESAFARFLKRTFDVVFSSLVILLLLSWLVPVIAFLIRIESRGPVFFVQKRTGKDNRDFNIIKFRSMTVNNDADKKQATKNDVRLTKMGKMMRKTNIDELPQFFNVWMGDMSVVGPRPHMLQHTREYSEIINQYMVRHFVKPGITGWAQINGFRGETTEPHMMEKRVEYDVWYLENWSLILDFSIVIQTVFNVFKGEKNAY